MHHFLGIFSWMWVEPRLVEKKGTVMDSVVEFFAGSHMLP